jgi:hypothetical protein
VFETVSFVSNSGIEFCCTKSELESLVQQVNMFLDRVKDIFQLSGNANGVSLANEVAFLAGLLVEGLLSDSDSSDLDAQARGPTLRSGSDEGSALNEDRRRKATQLEALTKCIERLKSFVSRISKMNPRPVEVLFKVSSMKTSLEDTIREVTAGSLLDISLQKRIEVHMSRLSDELEQWETAIRATSFNHLNVKANPAAETLSSRRCVDVVHRKIVCKQQPSGKVESILDAIRLMEWFMGRLQLYDRFMIIPSDSKSFDLSPSQERDKKTMEGILRRYLFDTAMAVLTSSQDLSVSDLCSLLSSDVEATETILKLTSKSPESLVRELDATAKTTILELCVRAHSGFFKSFAGSLRSPIFRLMESLGERPVTLFDVVGILSEVQTVQSVVEAMRKHVKMLPQAILCLEDCSVVKSSIQMSLSSFFAHCFPRHHDLFQSVHRIESSWKSFKKGEYKGHNMLQSMVSVPVSESQSDGLECLAAIGLDLHAEAEKAWTESFHPFFSKFNAIIDRAQTSIAKKYIFSALEFAALLAQCCFVQQFCTAATADLARKAAVCLMLSRDDPCLALRPTDEKEISSKRTELLACKRADEETLAKLRQEQTDATPSAMCPRLLSTPNVNEIQDKLVQLSQKIEEISSSGSPSTKDVACQLALLELDSRRKKFGQIASALELGQRDIEASFSAFLGSFKVSKGSEVSAKKTLCKWEIFGRESKTEESNVSSSFVFADLLEALITCVMRVDEMSLKSIWISMERSREHVGLPLLSGCSLVKSLQVKSSYNHTTLPLFI